MVFRKGTLEMLGINQFSNIFQDKRVLITGHNGFKGSWLALWLTQLGAKVTGISLPLESEFNHLNALEVKLTDHQIDIRNFNSTLKVFLDCQPDIVFHLAAQSLVRRSYRNPLDTWSTNVMGTVNILEACRQTKSVSAIVVITSDKCYKNEEWAWGYRENDSLGGHDPYSASKACAELVASSYQCAFFNSVYAPLIATARAGNVIGGGDWSEDRLFPDLVRSSIYGQSLEIRSPKASRPWQHVLESLSGYLLLGQKLLEGQKKIAEPWNFGPESNDNLTVSEILIRFNKYWPDLLWHIKQNIDHHETTSLYLDSAKARSEINWQPVWDINITLEKTAEWYQTWLKEKKSLSLHQLSQFINDASKKNIVWIDQ